MQASTVESLMSRLTEKDVQAARDKVNAAVAEAMEQQVVDGKIMVLTPTEVQVLDAFRKWSVSPGSASGVFQWRKQYGRKIDVE